MTDRQRLVLAAFRAAPAPMDLREIRKALRIEVPKWEIKDDVAALHKLGLIDLRGRLSREDVPLALLCAALRDETLRSDKEGLRARPGARKRDKDEPGEGLFHDSALGFQQGFSIPLRGGDGAAVFQPSEPMARQFGGRMALPFASFC